MSTEAERLIAALHLEPLPQEGGYFRATWRGEGGSAILFLITPDAFSALHRIAQDELWHFYSGDPVEHVQIDARGTVRATRLGADALAGDVPQLLVPRGTWQGARLAPHGEGATRPARGFALLGCSLVPAWDERGFELGERTELCRAFPAAADMIRALTR